MVFYHKLGYLGVDLIWFRSDYAVSDVQKTFKSQLGISIGVNLNINILLVIGQD